MVANNFDAISDATIRRVINESIRAHRKHGEGGSLLGDGLTDAQRLAALVEEVGEVAECLTYDKSLDGLEEELIQVGNVALSWATWLRRQRT